MSEDVRTFYIGDPHIGHKAAVTFRGFESITEMNETLLSRWNSVVRPKDKVNVVGDVVINRSWLSFWEHFNGRKTLVKGNHDTFRLSEYAQYFEDVVSCVCCQGFIVTHIPIHPSELTRFGCNVHAHTHNKSLDDPRYFCISAEQLDFVPIEHRCLVDKIRSRSSTL